MADNDSDRRVELRTTLVGSGSGTTPERIAEIEQRARELEKLGRKPPVRAFSEVLKTKSKKEPPTEEEAKDAEDGSEKKAPRPALVHPSQRELFGRGDDSNEPIVLKG